jgi:hypothetical protein
MARWIGITLMVSLAACSFSDGVIPTLPPTTATMFVADYTAGMVYRIAISRDAEPEITFVIVQPGALSPVMSPVADELLVSELTVARLDRYANPLDTPLPRDPIEGVGLATTVSKIAIVEDEMWLANPAAGNVDRVGFDRQGVPMMVGEVAMPNTRGIAFEEAARAIYISQCCGTDTIRHLHVADGGEIEELTPFMGNGLANPHGLVVTPWSELWVANAQTSEVLRYALDADGTPITPALAPLTGNGLATPIDLQLTPWGELYVTNLTGGTISRFTFDQSHTPTPTGMFAIPGALTLGWTMLVLGPSR